MKDVHILVGMAGLILFCFYTFLSSIGVIKSLHVRKVL